MAENRQSRTMINRPVGYNSTASAIALTPKEIFGILRRHLVLMIFLTFLGVIIGGVSCFLLKMYYPKYTAQTYIRVLPPTEKDPMTIATGTLNKDIQYGYRLLMAGLLKQQSTLQELVNRDKIQETEWFKRLAKIKDKRITRAVKNLKKKFGVYPQRDGDYITVSMTCTNKKEAALIVNEMVKLFLASQGSAKRGEIAAKLTKLEDRRKFVQRDLDSAEKSLDDVRKRWGIADLDSKRQFEHTITRRLNDLELEQNDLLLSVSQTKSSIMILEKQAAGPVNEQVSHQIESDPTMIMLIQQLVSQESLLAGRLTKFGENHRVVRQIKEQIVATEKERRLRKLEIAEQTRQSNLKNAQDGLVMLLSRLKELNLLREEASKKKKDLDLARVQFAQRVTVRDERRQMLDLVKEKVEKLKIMYDDPETPKVMGMGAAPVPLEMSSPLYKLYLPGGMMLGLMIAVGLAFLIELLNDLVRTPRDITRHLHIPLLGVIPDADEDEQLQDVDLCHIVRQAPYSMLSESYRHLRTNIKLSSSVESMKVLLVSSSMSGDGKTSVAINLATTFVAENKTVLLIDANFWRPGLQTAFPNSNSETNEEANEESGLGLSNLLMAQCGYREVIRSTGMEGFDIIDSGMLPSNSAELLGGAHMQQLIKHQRQSYDYVIIDGPPILLVSEAKILARLVDSTILVFNATKTRRGVAQRTIRELKEINALIAGGVLLAVKAMKGGYYSEQFKSYQEYQKSQLAHSV